MYGTEEFNWAAGGLAIVGFFAAWWYVGYLGTGAGFVTKIFSGLLTMIVGYFVAATILER